jgi:hypothetical protein
MMKRLLVLGSVALAIGGVVLLSRLLGGKEGLLSFMQEDAGRRNLMASHPDVAESEFEGLDFLV